MGSQLALPLEPFAEPESLLKEAWAHAGLPLPYQEAIHVPALAICLRNLAVAEKRRKLMENCQAAKRHRTPRPRQVRIY